MFSRGYVHDFKNQNDKKTRLVVGSDGIWCFALLRRVPKIILRVKGFGGVVTAKKINGQKQNDGRTSATNPFLVPNAPQCYD